MHCRFCCSTQIKVWWNEIRRAKRPYVSRDDMIYDPPVSIPAPLLLCLGRGSVFFRPLYALLASPISFSCVNSRNDFDEFRSIESEMSINYLMLSVDGLPLRLASNAKPVSRNFSISLRTALRWGTGVSGNFLVNCSCNELVYLLPSRKTYSTRKTRP
jgi:hypothetical protein